MKKSTVLKTSAGSTLAAAVAVTLPLAGAARAQTANQVSTPATREIEAMVVTGSIIPQSEVATSLPVSTYTAEDIEKTGASTVQQFLQTLPINSGARFQETVNTGLSFSPGAAAIALRGLNVNATLVLLNGRRVAPYALAQSGTDSFVDTNSIPLAAIDRIEILREGASAIYGSDAIAGVVNIITKKNFSGTEVFMQYGNTTRSDDMMRRRGSIVTGLTELDGKFRLMLSVDYYSQNPLADKDRAFSKNANHIGQGGTDQRSVRPNPGTFFLEDGSVVRPPPGSNGRLSTGDFLNGLTPDGLDYANRYNFNRRSELIPDSERAGYFGTVEYDVNKHITLFGEGFWQSVRTKEHAAPTPIDTADGVVVGANNPYNPFRQDLQFLYRMLDLGDRISVTQNDSFRFLGGVKIRALPKNWTVEIAGMTSENHVVSKGYNFASISRSQYALNSANPDEALNVFGDGTGFNSDHVLHTIRTRTSLIGLSKLGTADIRASGDLAELPAGPIGLGLGAEYREETLSVTPDRRSQAGDIIGQGGVTAAGARSSKGAYFQLDVPFASPQFNCAGIYALNFIIAGRAESFTDFGDVFKPKLSLRYKPVEWLTMRGSYQEGFRAPSLAQLFLGNVTGFESIIDPAHPEFGTVDVTSVTNGNASLKPETAYAYSAGFVLDVPKVKGLTLSADFYRIEQRNLISAPTAQFVVDHPGFSAGATLVRDDQGNLIQVNTPFANIGKVVVDGVDFEVEYELPWKKWGTWTFDWNGSYVNSYEQAPGPGQPNLEFIRTFQLPAFRTRGAIDWEYKGFSAEVALNYTSSYTDDGVDREVGAWTTIDMQVAYEFHAPKAEVSDGKSFDGRSDKKEIAPVSAGATWWQKLLDGTKLTVGVTNVADEDPPFANLTEGYDTSTGDPSGRFYYVSLRKRF